MSSEYDVEEVKKKIFDAMPDKIGSDDLSYLVGSMILEYSPDKDAAMFHLGRAAGHLTRYLTTNPEHFTRKELH